MNTPAPDCRLGGTCELVSRAHELGTSRLGRAGVVQCVKCSTVYEPTGWRPRTCGACAREWGDSLHDPCLGELPDVVAACCGHGDPDAAFRIYTDGRREGTVPS